MITFSKTKIRCSGCILMLFTLLSGGCGEFAYKRGANLSDFETAKKSCRAKWPDSVAVEKCMADSGWVVQNLSKMEPMDADPVVEASVIPSHRRIENPVRTTLEKQSSEDNVFTLPGSAQPTTIAKRNPDVMDPFKVSSWWKTGSGAESLKSDTEECVTQLGEAHRPDNPTQYATRGLLLCMKEKGWSGLRAK
jgi:hypothetical protein